MANPLRNSKPSGYGTYTALPDEPAHTPTPVVNNASVGWHQEVLLSWTWGLFWRGVRGRDIEDQNVPPLLKTLSIDSITDVAHTKWEKERNKEIPQMEWLLLSTWKWELVWFVVLGAVQGVIGAAIRPLLLKWIISAATDDVPDTDEAGKFLGVLGAAMVVEGVTAVMGRMQFSGRVASGGIVTLAALIQEKALKLASGGKSSEKSLIGNDLTRVYENSKIFALMPSSFASMVSGAAMILFTTGLPGLAGLGMLVLVLIANQWMAKVSARREAECLTAADKRVVLITRVIEGIKAVKLSTWEVPFLDRIFSARSEEGKALSAFRMVTQTSVQVGRAAPTLACCVTFSVMVWTDAELKVEDIFAVYSVFQAMRLSLIILPRGMSIIETNRVSFRRISEYLRQEDFSQEASFGPEDSSALRFTDAQFCHFSEENAPKKGASQVAGPSSPAADNRKSLKSAVEGAEGGADAEEEDYTNEMRVDNRRSLALPAGFDVRKQEEQQQQHQQEDDPSETLRSEKFVLKVPGLELARGEAAALIGEVGSGKSSVISAILGDMQTVRSTTQIFGSAATCIADTSIGFVPQKSYITCGTILENVVMGRDFDEVMFRDAVTRSCLNKDLEALPGGRYTEIGERGVTLSGGQQQRVCIARALYGDPRLLLLDDPLAAVDSHVANLLFYNIVHKRKPGQTVLIALNQHKFLKHFTKIVRMEHGIAHISTRSSDNVEPCTEPQSHFEREPTPETDEPATTGKAFKDTLIAKEAQGKGAVKTAVLVEYVKSMGWFWTVISLSTIVVTYGIMAFSDRWLAKWTSEYDDREPEDVASYYLYVFIGASVAFAAGLITSSITLSKATVRASETLHNDCCEGVVHAPLDWFNKTPSGRILSRFTSDTSNLDVQFGHAVDNVVQQIATLTVLLGMICVIVPPVIPVVVVSCVAYWLVVVVVDKSNREVKRLGNNAMSPVLSTVGEISEGRLILRAMGLSPAMRSKFIGNYDLLTKYNYASNGIMHLGMLVSYFISIVISLCTGLLMLYGPGSSDLHPSLLALALTYSFMLPYFFLFLALFFSRFKSIMTSLERLLECKYGVPQEPTWFKPTDTQLPKGWPHKGNVSFEDVRLVYREGMKPAIDGVTVGFTAGSSTGVVGRTGAGKSSLVAVLFRLNEANGGRVIIDGVDAASVGLQTLRRGMAVIPQDPLLIDGTIRNNLDPFTEYDEARLRTVLDRVGLISVDLYDPAASLSVGEKQLITLCRALLNTRTNIVIMDEPTSNIDQRTDAIIQEVLREDWAHKTVITIAHRINTIIDYDKILVMSDGRVAQHGPSGVLARTHGIFQELVASSGVVLKEDTEVDAVAEAEAERGLVDEEGREVQSPSSRQGEASSVIPSVVGSPSGAVEDEEDEELKTIRNMAQHSSTGAAVPTAAPTTNVLPTATDDTSAQPTSPEGEQEREEGSAPHSSAEAAGVQGELPADGAVEVGAAEVEDVAQSGGVGDKGEEDRQADPEGIPDTEPAADAAEVVEVVDVAPPSEEVGTERGTEEDVAGAVPQADAAQAGDVVEGAEEVTASATPAVPDADLHSNGDVEEPSNSTAGDGGDAVAVRDEGGEGAATVAMTPAPATTGDSVEAEADVPPGAADGADVVSTEEVREGGGDATEVVLGGEGAATVAVTPTAATATGTGDSVEAQVEADIPPGAADGADVVSPEEEPPAEAQD